MRLTGVDLNLLVAFDALMAERSVTRAAERLTVGQPAMSATLGRLRRLFDDPLLVRQGRHLVATPLAESLVDPVHEALSMIEQTLAARSSFDPATERRTFSVVASDYVTLVFLRPFLMRLAAEAPNVRVHVRPVTADFRDQLRRGQTDLLIMPLEVLGRAHKYPTSALFTDRYVCAVGADNNDVGKTMTRKQFSQLPYLAYNAGPLESLAEQQLDAAGIFRNLEVSVESFVLAPYLLAGTGLLTLIHERLARVVQDHLSIRLLEPPVSLSPITEVMSWAPRHETIPRTRGCGGGCKTWPATTSPCAAFLIEGTAGSPDPEPSPALASMPSMRAIDNHGLCVAIESTYSLPGIDSQPGFTAGPPCVAITSRRHVCDHQSRHNRA